MQRKFNAELFCDDARVNAVELMLADDLGEYRIGWVGPASRALGRWSHNAKYELRFPDGARVKIDLHPPVECRSTFVSFVRDWPSF